MKTELFISLLNFVQCGGELQASTQLYKVHEQGYGYNFIGHYSHVYDDREKLSYYVQLECKIADVVKISETV